MSSLKAFICIELYVIGAMAADWPQYQFDAARQGRSPDSPAPPYELAWVANFVPETVASQQPMVSGDLVFVATQQGRAYALDRQTGERRWVTDLNSPMVGMAAVEGDKVFWTTLKGAAIALEKNTGKPVWTTALEAGASASPCLADNAVFLGDRRGMFYRIEQADGAVAWKTRLTYCVFATAAYHDNRVFAVTEDMRAHCLDARTGGILWQSEKLAGMMFRNRAPVVTNGRVIFHTLPAEYLSKPPFTYPFGDETSPGGNAESDTAALREGSGYPQGFFENQQTLIEFLTENPQHQSMFILDEATGRQKEIPPVIRVLAGWTVALPPPAVDSRGRLTVPVPCFGNRYGFYDLETKRIVDVVIDMKPTNTDEHVAPSIGGERLFLLHYGVGHDCATDAVYHIAQRKSVLDIPGGNHFLHNERWGKDSKTRRVSVLSETVQVHPEWHVKSYVPLYGAAAISGNMFFKTEQRLAYTGSFIHGWVMPQPSRVAAWRGGAE